MIKQCNNSNESETDREQWFGQKKPIIKQVFIQTPFGKDKMTKS